MCSARCAGTRRAPRSFPTRRSSDLDTAQGSTATAAGGGEQPAAQPDTLILSDTLDYDDVKKESIFTGNVIMTRGDMSLHSDKLRSEEHTSELQSRENRVCRLLLEKK